MEDYDENELKSHFSLLGCTLLNDFVREWTEDEIALVMGYAMEWNTNGKNSRVISLLVQAIINTIGIKRLKTIPGVVHAMSTLLSYGERHFNRLNKLQEALYTVEFICSEAAVTDL